MQKITTLFILALLVAISGCKDEDITKYVHVGPNWAALNEIQAGKNSFDVAIDLAASVRLGEMLPLKVKSAQTGRLWILQVDPNDEVSMIYPNALAHDNHINAGSWLHIPAKNANWSIEAMPPTGVSVIAFIVTSQDADLSSVWDEISQRTDTMHKTLTIVEQASAWGIAKKIINIKE